MSIVSLLPNLSHLKKNQILTYKDSLLQCLGQVYMRVWVQDNQGPNHSLTDLTFRLKIGPKLEDWFLKLGGVFQELGSMRFGRTMPH